MAKYVVNYGATQSNGTRTITYNDGSKGVETVKTPKAAPTPQIKNSSSSGTRVNSGGSMSSDYVQSQLAENKTSANQAANNANKANTNGGGIVTVATVGDVPAAQQTQQNQQATVAKDTGTTKEFGGVTFDTTKDYQAAINEAQAKGDTAAVKALSAQRQAKLDYGNSVGVDYINGTTTYKGVTFNNNTDYQTEINNAVAKGDYATAAKLESQRNAKINWGKDNGVSYGNNVTTTYNYSSIATDKDGNKYNLVKDSSGNLTLYNADWTPNTTYGGKITATEGADKQSDYIARVTKDSGVILSRIVSEPLQLMKYNADGSSDSASWEDEFGNKINSADLVFCEDNLTHNQNTGETIGDMLARLGTNVNKGDYFVQVGVGDNVAYYNLDGVNIDGESLATTTPNYWTADEKINALINALNNLGYNNTPKLSDYEVLTPEAALAQAREQLNGQYSQNLDRTLDQYNQKALETGLYGQLPTEALKQQAIAANEIDREAAIQDLARQLRGDSESWAQTQLSADRQTSQDRQTTVLNIYNILREYRQDELDKQTTQKDYDAKEQELINDAIQVYVYASANNVSYSDALKALGYSK